jgi:DNA-binding CsgD family transcriptional regulator
MTVAANTPEGGVFGRPAELAAIGRLLDPARVGARAVVLAGEAGIGKTTLVGAALRAAAAAGVPVLRAAPGEQERLIPFAGLADLLGPVDEQRLEALPPPQRVAIAAATHRAHSAGDPDALAVSLGCTALFRRLADGGLTLLVVDDVQWLDPATGRILEYALRRVADLPLAALVCIRTDRPVPAPLGLGRGFPAGAVETLRLGPLDVGALNQMLRTRLGLRLPRPALLRLIHITGGNPYYALEVAGSLAAAGELQVPPTLADALARRLAHLPALSRRALLLAAACLQPSVEVVTAAMDGQQGLALTVTEGLIDAEGSRLRFAHPLLASVAYERALPEERRAAHRRLAEVVVDPIEQALHRARGLDAPDAAAAASLEAGAAAAAAAGSDVAAELAEAAARLTPPDDREDRDRRLVAAADLHCARGDPGRGREILEDVIAGLGPGPERAALLWRLADTIGDDIAEPIRLCEQALDEAGDDPALVAEIHTALGVFTWIAGDLVRSLDHCRSAVRWAERAGDDERLAIAIGEVCHAEAILGLPWDRGLMDRALAIEAAGVPITASLRPSIQRAVIALITDEPDVAERILRQEVIRTRAISDQPGLFHALMRLSEVCLRTGRWADALGHAREGHELATQSGIEQEQSATAVALAAVLAHVGDLGEAERLAADALAIADGGGDRGVALRAAGVLGLVHLSRGRPDLALGVLTPASRELRAMGTGELSISGVVQNEIEALVATGELDTAAAVAREVEAIGLRGGRLWHLAVAARGRALVASALSDYEGAATAVEEALRAHEDLPQPFERARTLLAGGLVERRAKHWAAARAQLAAALEAFDALGAAAWAERTADELGRLPGRRPNTRELTATELQVAELVADGLSNKEIAARMFVSVRTVEANLTRAYAKLGVQSRVELARRLGR